MKTINIIKPHWSAPENVQTLVTTRQGGISKSPFDDLNLALHVEDNPDDVRANRQLLNQYLPTEPKWLNQTHSNKIIELNHDTLALEPFDACYTTEANVVCTILTADCLPILLTDCYGRFVAAIHGGWRGLAKCIIANSVATIRLRDPQIQAKDIIAWLGPAIGVTHFEVGVEVKDQLLTTLYAQPTDLNVLFKVGKNPDKCYCDIYQFAKLQLAQLGIEQVFGGEYCTVTDSERFFSYRRDGQTGRMANMIWLNEL